MLEYLKQLKSSGNVPLADCVKSFCSRNTGKGVLVLITDLMDKSGYETALKYLVARESGHLRDSRSLAGGNRSGHSRRFEAGRLRR